MKTLRWHSGRDRFDSSGDSRGAARVEEIAQKEGPQGGPFLFVASPGRDEIIYIPGTGMISTTSIHAPGIWKWGWSLPNIFVAASADSACTIE
jgi:hypothetical protein